MIKNKLSWWQWFLIGIGGLLVLLGIPYLLNHFIQQPQQFTIVGEGKDWLMFWAAWLGAIASFAMVIATFISLRQNRKQVEELKRQWEEQNRPYISTKIIRKEFNIGAYTQYEFHLCLTNIGNSTAHNTRITIDKDYLNSIYKCLDDPQQANDVIFKSYKKECIDRIKKIIDVEVSLQKGQRIDFHFITFMDYHTQSLSSSPSSFAASRKLAKILQNTPIPITLKYRGYIQNEEVTFQSESIDTADVLNILCNKIDKIATIYESEVKLKYDKK